MEIIAPWSKFHWLTQLASCWCPFCVCCFVHHLILPGHCHFFVSWNAPHVTISALSALKRAIILYTLLILVITNQQMTSQNESVWSWFCQIHFLRSDFYVLNRHYDLCTDQNFLKVAPFGSGQFPAFLQTEGWSNEQPQWGQEFETHGNWMQQT